MRQPVWVTGTRAVLPEVRYTVHTRKNTGAVCTLNRTPVVVAGAGVV
jgi:hypothetical protein